jgi:ribonuclease P protein component
VGAKAVGNAVARNRVKRVVRDWFRCCKADLPALDLIVGARNGAASAHNAQLRESLSSLRRKFA